MTAIEPRPEPDFEKRDEFGNNEANVRFLRETLAAGSGRRVLEIGSGRGALLRQLLQEGLRVQGVEINQDRIDESRRLFGDLPITKVDGPALPFADASFDVVLSFDVFEHIPDSDAHLREVQRVLAPGGRYLLQTPNKWTNTVFETIRWRSVSSWRHDHCSLHSYQQLRHRFERHGFDVRFADVPVVTAFFRRKLRHYLGGIAPVLLAVGNPDRLPIPLRTNFYVIAEKRDRT
jgi:ubiquinone/menaquinone biosynthesis C-methylase UbiE